MEVDAKRQVLHIAFRGSVSAADMRVGSQSLEALISRLQPGFTVLTELTGLDCMDLDCVPELTRVMDRMVAAGAGQVVRVIPDPDKDIGFTLLSLTHYRGHVPITTYPSVAEARQALDRGQ